MSFTAERLYELLPTVHRQRDADAGGPLRAVLEVVADQVAVLEENLAQLYDDEFVETCAPWVLPYIGELLGITGLPGAPLSSRAEVANTIAYRRRKGTASVLERLARDISGLPARAVEYFQVLATTQHLNHLRPDNRSVLSLRGALRLEDLGSPFEHLAGEMDIPHTAEIRRIPPRRGRYNIPNVGIFLWRLRPYALTRSPAVPAQAGDAQRFHFAPLGNDTPLFRLPETEEEPTQLAAPLNVPGRISRRWLAEHAADEYGSDRSFYIERPGAGPAGSLLPVAPENIVACDLEGWELPGWNAPPAGEVHVDPVLGRLAFGDMQAQPPLVSCHFGFSADVGGGEYNRTIPAEETSPITVGTIRAGTHSTIAAALAALPAAGGVIEILDSGRYADDFAIAAAGCQVTVRAADGFRPTIILGNDLHISGDANGAVTLDGLLVTGAGVIVDADGPGHVTVRHCTLVPGLALVGGGMPSATAASLTLHSPGTHLAIESSIVGAVRAVLDADVEVSGSIIDATAERRVAYADTTGAAAGAPLTLDCCTVIGKVFADALVLASNTIFVAALEPGDAAGDVWHGPVQVRRRQEGCVRFCYLPPGSRTPRRYRCAPAGAADVARVRPVFSATIYGDPAYAQLGVATPDQIRRGADDESELGVFHDEFLPRREAHLVARLDEYLRFGQEAGVFYVT